MAQQRKIPQNLAKITQYSPGASLTPEQREHMDSSTVLRIGLFGSFGVGKSALADTLLSYNSDGWNEHFAIGPVNTKAKTTQWESTKLSDRALIYDNRGINAPKTEKALNIVSRQLRGYFGDNSEVNFTVDLTWWQKHVQTGIKKDEMINAPVLVIDASDDLFEPSAFSTLFKLFKDTVGVDAVVVLTKTDTLVSKDKKNEKVSAYADALGIHVDNIFCVRAIGSERQWDQYKDDPDNLKELSLLCSAIARVADRVNYNQSDDSCVIL